MKKVKFNESDFVTSSWCPVPGRCVKVAHKVGIIAVADSKNPKQEALQFDKNEWQAFIIGVKNDEFDY
ncbi:MAG: hypothetical protein A3E87_05625 [Gammaproteobacteria bacterium RIFCSPHIGHO2_12_FULL_35_23]|nr:MAG: hypothetical protein A3E87_05625 [Gammaproteobacteria bacterium RIFCSPHIGHO2_12_FULL_35_23]